MIRLVVFDRAGATLARVPIRSGGLELAHSFGQSYLTGSAATEAVGYRIEDASGAPLETVTAPSPIAFRCGDRVAVTGTPAHGEPDGPLAVYYGRVRDQTIAPHTGGACYAIEVERMLVDGRAARLAGETLLYVPVTARPPHLIAAADTATPRSAPL